MDHSSRQVVVAHSYLKDAEFFPVTMVSSSIGPDGRQHVEKYAKSSSGNTAHKVSHLHLINVSIILISTYSDQIRETKEAYTNSSAGIDRLAWERQLENRGRRVVQERNRNTEVLRKIVLTWIWIHII